MGPLRRPQLSASPTRTRTKRLCSGHKYAGKALNEGLTVAPFLKRRVQSAAKPPSRPQEAGRVRGGRPAELALLFVATAVEDPELPPLAAHDAAPARAQWRRRMVGAQWHLSEFGGSAIRVAG